MLHFSKQKVSGCLFFAVLQADGGLRVHPAGKSEPARRDAELVFEEESGWEGHRANGGGWHQ